MLCQSTNSDISEVELIRKKYKNHPSILKIKQIVTGAKFSFQTTTTADIEKEMISLDSNRAIPFNDIPVKILKGCLDLILPPLQVVCNSSFANNKFPNALKLAEVKPSHKKDDMTDKGNYRPISILPTVSKIFERIMYKAIATYMEKYFSPFLCGLRKGYSAQDCLIVMTEKWEKAIDKKENAGAILTDLSKAFDTLNHQLLIAK